MAKSLNVKKENTLAVKTWSGNWHVEKHGEKVK
jgi:hypothetical protein